MKELMTAEEWVKSRIANSDYMRAESLTLQPTMMDFIKCWKSYQYSELEAKHLEALRAITEPTERLRFQELVLSAQILKLMTHCHWHLSRGLKIEVEFDIIPKHIMNQILKEDPVQ